MQNRIVIFFQKLYKKIPVISFDSLAIPLAWYAAYYLRYNMEASLTLIDYNHFSKALLLLFIVQMACYYHYRVYRGIWRFSSLNDLMRILKAALSATVLAIPLFYICSLIQFIPRSVPPLYAIIYVTLLSSGRLLRRNRWDRFIQSGMSNQQQVLIIGAGAAGEWLVRDMKRSREYLPVAIIDDDLGKQGLEIHGVRVLGQTKNLARVALEHEVDLILIAIPSANSQAMREIVAQCDKTSIPYRTLPGISDLVSGKASIQSFRQVNLEDLLGRDQVFLEWDKIALDISNRRVLVTGGGGSIGSELCRQILRLKPESLHIIDNSEFNLYEIENELKAQKSSVKVHVSLASVTDYAAMNSLFSDYRPDIVFHTAAYKHVPMLESQIRTAVYNNVIGTQIVAEASVGLGVEKFIMISSDKAVNPTNVMGTTKRVAEIYCQNLNHRVDTQFITVRFGNVLGSAGSVVPLFQKQLAVGGPLTVTDPHIERYFMTIPEASQLILQAMANGQGGEIFVLDMGKPIKISYLAEQMIRLSGHEPYKDIDIQYTGLRRGEKLFEELFHQAEALQPTAHDKLLIAKYRACDWSLLHHTMQHIHAACQSFKEEELLVLLQQIVPEFQYEMRERV